MVDCVPEKPDYRRGYSNGTVVSVLQCNGRLGMCTVTVCPCVSINFVFDLEEKGIVVSRWKVSTGSKVTMVSL